MSGTVRIHDSNPSDLRIDLISVNCLSFLRAYLCYGKLLFFRLCTKVPAIRVL